MIRGTDAVIITLPDISGDTISKSSTKKLEITIFQPYQPHISGKPHAHTRTHTRTHTHTPHARTHARTCTHTTHTHTHTHTTHHTHTHNLLWYALFHEIWLIKNINRGQSCIKQRTVKYRYFLLQFQKFGKCKTLSVKLTFGSLWLLSTHTSLVCEEVCLYKLCFVTEWSASCEKHRCHNASVTVTAALLLLFLRMTLLLPFYTPYTSLLTDPNVKATQNNTHHDVITLITWLLCLSGIWDLIALEN